MKNTRLHIMFIVVIAIMLVYLYQKSQFPQHKYDQTNLFLLNLSHLNALLDKQTLELQNGYFHHYDNINRSASALRSLSSSLAQQSPYHQKLQKLIADKLEKIEQFKQNNALLRNALHYLPRLNTQYQKILHSLPDSKALSAEKEQIQQMLSASLLASYLVNSGIRINMEQLLRSNKMLEETIKHLAWLNEADKRMLLKVVAFSRSAILFYQKVVQLVGQIQSPQIQKLITELQQQNNQQRYQQKESAGYYLTWLVVVAFLLLFYLAFVFRFLTKTRKQLTATLTELEFQKEAIDHHAIVSITDVKGNILYANKRFLEVSGYRKDEIIGKNHRIIKSGVHDRDYYKNIWQTISRGNIWQGEIVNKNKHGDYYWVETTIMPRLNEQGKPYQYIAIRTDITSQKQAEQKAMMLARFPEENPLPVMRVNRHGELIYANPASKVILQHWNTGLQQSLPSYWQQQVKKALASQQVQISQLDTENRHFLIHITPIKGENYINLYFLDITQTKKAEEQLSYQATHDLLTGLLNRLAFEQKLQTVLQHCQQNPDDQAVLLYLDLDQFKVVNDTCGHVAGDELLRQLAQLLGGQMRATDMLARLGGDEFGIILMHCPETQARKIAWTICQTVKDFRFCWENKSFEIGVSIGMVDICGQINSVSDALGAADIACYMAKDAGRNQVQKYLPNASGVVQQHQEMMWATKIPQALDEERFILYAQKIQPLDIKQSPHYEILIRLRSEQEQLTPPGAFIPAAERFGLVNALDLWVIEQSLHLLQHAPANRQNLNISINLSGLSLGNESFLYQVLYLINNSNLPAGNLTFEITETAAISNLSLAIEFIQEVKKLGCHFALDDFGSGLSSFAYLKNLPVDYLKIDGAFVKDILDDPIDEAMVSSINQIGHIMKIKTIAEFVENDQIKQRLETIGVDYVQGYGIERPRPFGDILQEKQP